MKRSNVMVRLRHVFIDHLVVALFVFVFVSLLSLNWNEILHTNGSIELLLHVLFGVLLYVIAQFVMPYCKYFGAHYALDRIITRREIMPGDASSLVLALLVERELSAKLDELFGEQGIQVGESELIDISSACFRFRPSVWNLLFKRDRPRGAYFAFVTSGLREYLGRFPQFNAALRVAFTLERQTVRIMAVEEQLLHDEWKDATLRGPIEKYVRDLRLASSCLLCVDPNVYKSAAKTNFGRESVNEFAVWTERLVMVYRYEKDGFYISIKPYSSVLIEYQRYCNFLQDILRHCRKVVVEGNELQLRQLDSSSSDDYISMLGG